MNRTITSMLIAAMLSVGALGSFAVDSFASQHHQGQQMASTSNMLTGHITKIRTHNLTLKDQSGKYHVVSFSSASMVQGLKSGDEVTVSYQNGKATSIKKVEGSSMSGSSNKPM